MTVKRMTAALLAFCMLLSLGACGRQNAENTAPETTEPATESTTEPQQGTTRPTEPATTQSVWDIIGLKINPATRIEPDFSALSVFPEYSSDFYGSDGFQINLPRRDLSSLDLSTHLDALRHSVFDTMTVWPETLPEGFDPDEIIERGKDPGLDIRTLHEMGIDGRGVSIGIIDGPLLLEHTEYSLGQIVCYEEFGAEYFDSDEAFHGNGVASLAVGKSTGVAPGASLYYMAASVFGPDGGISYEHWTQALERLLDINKQLSEGEKIRAVSISWSLGYDESVPGCAGAIAAMERARDEGVMVFSVNMYSFVRVPFISGACREPMGNPNDKGNYSLGSWEKPNYEGHKDGILIPMDSRSFASWAGENEYCWTWMGGWSWVMPYVTGLYALCAQLYPDLTYELFFGGLSATADTLIVDNLGESVPIILVNPRALVEYFQKTIT